jgi:hypothetical protein
VNRKKIYQRVIWGILATLLLVGCGAPTATLISEPSPEPIVEVGEVTFNGTECIVSIPTELQPGRYSFVLKNLSEEEVGFYVSRLTDGKTFQDLLDFQNEPGDYVPHHNWIKNAVGLGSAWQKPDGGEVYSFKLISEGEYVVSVWILETPESEGMKIWFCAPFWVKEVP